MEPIINLQFSYGEFQTPTDSEDLLYHYCSMETLVSIIKNGKIRLGDLKSMNDPSEMKLQEINMANIIYNEYQKNPFEFDIGENGAHYGIKELLTPYQIEYKLGQCGKYSNLLFAFCLSGKCNDLSQWRLYGDNGKGVCLGFKKADMKKLIEANSNFSLEKIEYFKSINDVATNVANLVLDKIKNMYELKKFQELKQYRFDIIKELVHYWPKFKTCDYESEDETRLIFNLNNCQIFSNTTAIQQETIKDVDVRVRNGELALFKEIPLNNLGLKTITLGPTNNTTKDGLNILLAKNGLNIGSENIFKSNIPYRN